MSHLCLFGLNNIDGLVLERRNSIDLSYKEVAFPGSGTLVVPGIKV